MFVISCVGLPIIIIIILQKFTVYVGEPLDLSCVLQYCVSGGKTSSSNPVVCRKQITDLIQDKMRELRIKAEGLHSSWNCNSRVAYRQL